MTIQFRPGCNGPYAECDYELLLESLRPFVPNPIEFELLASDIISCSKEHVELTGCPGMKAVGHELDMCGVLIWIHEESKTVEPEQICISKAGLTFSYNETVNEPDKFMITSEEIYRRAELIRSARTEVMID